jgi:phospholipid N-methyltransferase
MARQTKYLTRQGLLFYQNFLKNPQLIGALIPSSSFLVERVLHQIDWSRAGIVVEHGPGVGTITAEILNRLPSHGRLVAIEYNQDFVEYLRSTLPDPRLQVVHGRVQETGLHLQRLGFKQADYIISNIPYTSLPPEERESIIRQSRAVLRPDGAMMVSQFTNSVLPHLKASFRNVQLEVELLNIPPGRVFYCTA